MTDEQQQETSEDAQQRYLYFMHALQSGVAAKQGLDPSETEPKNLRVGVNSAMLQQGTVVRLLIAKGIITAEEWWIALADSAQAEVQAYEKWLSDKTGANVTLQ